MAFKGVDQKSLLDAIDRTLDIWRALKFEYADQAAVLRPLCQNIHQQTKANTAICNYCPVHKFGYHHTCVAIDNIRIGDSSDAAKREFTNIKKLVTNGLTRTKKIVQTDTAWKEYCVHIQLKKAGALKRSPVVKKLPEPVVNTRKIYKTRRTPNSTKR